MRTVLYVNDAVAIGGGERNLLSWIQALKGSDWTPVVTAPTHGPFPALLRESGIPVELVRLPDWRKLRDVPRAVWAWITLNRLAGCCGAALIHANSPSWFPVASLVARYRGIPSAVSVQSRLRDARVRQWMVHKADLVFTVSASLTGLVEQAGVPPGRTHALYSTVDTEHFRPVDRSAERCRELGIPDDAPVFGCIANIAPYKGQDLLVEALPEIFKQVPTAHCLLVGRDTEPFAQQLKASVRRMGLSDRVHFAGFHPDVRPFVGLVDVVVLPSRIEGMPVALLEAMAMGKPLVASAVDGTPETIDDGHTGLLVPPENPGAVARAVVDLLRNPDRCRAFGEAGRRKAERFALPRARETLLSAYEGALTSRARA